MEKIIETPKFKNNSILTHKAIGIIILCLIFSLSFSILTQGATASNTIKVTINGKELALDTPPVMESGRTLVPLRGIFEALNSSVVWDSKTQSVLATRDQTNIKIQIGNTKATKNNSQVLLDVPAKIINNRTYVPLRFISESFGSNVTWEAKTRTVIVVDKQVTMDYQQFAQYVLDQFGSLQVHGTTINLDMVVIEKNEEFPTEVNISLYVDYENFLKIEQLLKQGKDTEIESWLEQLGKKAQETYSENEIFGYLALYDNVTDKPTNLTDEDIEFHAEDSTYELFLDIAAFDNYEGFIDVTWFNSY